MDLGQALFRLIATPDVAYVLLVLGLISIAVAIGTPGTGLAEVAAVLCLVLSVIGLAQLPVNLAGLMLMLLGVAVFVADLKFQSGLMALGATVTLALGSLFLFEFSAAATGVSLWLIAIVTAGTAAFFVFGLARVVDAMRLKPEISQTNLVGASGVIVVAPSAANHLVGTAQVRSEIWTVRASEPLEHGTPVTVEEVDGLTLKVNKS
jgi:membrane-bound serine protease (ClpP class)